MKQIQWLLNDTLITHLAFYTKSSSFSALNNVNNTNDLPLNNTLLVK